MSAAADPIPLRQPEGGASPGLFVGGRVMRVFERSRADSKGATFTTDTILLYAGAEGGEFYVECGRSRDTGSRNPIVDAAEACLPSQASEFGRFLAVPVRATAYKDRVYLKAVWPRG